LGVAYFYLLFQVFAVGVFLDPLDLVDGDGADTAAVTGADGLRTGDGRREG
jgi:hypothetical protein